VGTPEPPPVVDPELQNLTFDQLAQLVEEVSPDALYESAAAFDAATARFEQVQDDLDGQSRHLWEAWSGRIAESFDDVVRRVSGRTGAVVQAMADPGYGAVLRRAGDALTQARQRVQDLRAQNRQNDVEAARQVLYDLGTAYRDLGAVLSPVPDAGTGLPSAESRSAPGAGPAGANPVAGHGQQTGPEQDTGGGGAPAGEGFAPLAAFAPVAAPGWTAQAAMAEPVSAPASVPEGIPCAAPAVLGRTTPAEAPAEAGSAEQPVAVAAAVLGRSATAKKPVAQPSQAKRAEASATTEEADRQDQQDQPGVAAEKVVTTSAVPAPQQGYVAEAARTVQTAEAAAAPAPVPAPAASAQAAPLTASAPSGHAAPVAAPPSSAPVAPVTAPTASAHGAAPTASSGSAPVVPASGPGGSMQPAGVPASAGFGVHEPVPAPGVPRAPGALPAAPAFQPVSGGLDATTTAGIPPVAPGVPGAPRPGGDHPASGGFVGSMLRGASGQDEQGREHDPAGYLEAGPRAWSSGEDGAPVLGRLAAPLPPAPEDTAAVLEEGRIPQDPEELRRALSRLGRQDES
jgi:uncharacterized protein YukE